MDERDYKAMNETTKEKREFKEGDSVKCNISKQCGVIDFIGSDYVNIYVKDINTIYVCKEKDLTMIAEVSLSFRLESIIEDLKRLNADLKKENKCVEL
tara:strand:+ start:283 stop:576 length:294 start_codon:yes stop_codon:yes gene_type:complete